MSRPQLYPTISPNRTGTLCVDPIHEIYWEESGNARGVPVVFLHGGPGAGASPMHRRFFDPRHYRIIIMDQRGAGRSKPLGEVRNNTTQHLIDDLETLRAHLDVPRWHLFGGSWGSTLALAYAQQHPQCCLSLTLRGIFLMRRMEIDWFLYGMWRIFPEAWQRFSGHIGPEGQEDLLGAYHRLLMDPDPAIHRPAATIWSQYESACSTLYPGPAARAPSAEGSNYGLSLSRIEAHYFVHNLFEPEDRLLQEIDRIRQIPATIVQGRYDIVCPIGSADALHHAWPEAHYVIVPDAGHSAMEPGISQALIEATNRYRAIG